MAELATIARPYAQAIFGMAEGSNNFAKWSDLLAALKVVIADKQVDNLINNPKVGHEQLSTLLTDVCGSQLDDDVDAKNFIRLLAENGRIAVLSQIAEIYEELRNQAEGTIQAELIAPKPVTDEEKEKIATALKKRLGRDVSLQCSVDESLIGGALIRAGDLVIDGSVRGKLNRLASALGH